MSWLLGGGVRLRSWMWRYHAPADGGYRDYWRFSIDGVQHLFREFRSVEIEPVRGRAETLLNLIPHLGKGSRFISTFGGTIRKLDRTTWKHASGFNIFAVK